MVATIVASGQSRLAIRAPHFVVCFAKSSRAAEPPCRHFDPLCIATEPTAPPCDRHERAPELSAADSAQVKPHHTATDGRAGVFLTAANMFGDSRTGLNAAALPNGIGVAVDNSNVAGVTGGSDAANQAAAAAVATGIELSIPLAALGNPGGAFRISAMINGSNHDYLSNQFLGGLTPPQGNLGGDGAGSFNGTVGQLNLNSFAGDQYFTVVPEPASLALFGLVCLVRRRA